MNQNSGKNIRTWIHPRRSRPRAASTRAVVSESTHDGACGNWLLLYRRYPQAISEMMTHFTSGRDDAGQNLLPLSDGSIPNSLGRSRIQEYAR